MNLLVPNMKMSLDWYDSDNNRMLLEIVAAKIKMCELVKVN